MKVKELIEKLLECDQELTCLYYYDSEPRGKIEDIYVTNDKELGNIVVISEL